MVIFFIILTLLALLVLYYAGIAIVYAVCFLIIGIRLAFGKTTIDQLNEKAAKTRLSVKADKAKIATKSAKSKGGFSFLSYPSPLNGWGLWN